MEQNQEKCFIIKKKTMTENENKKITEILIEAIKAKGITIEKLSQLTGVSINIIQNLLGNNYKKLPAKPYLHGYLIKISEVLNLDGKKIWKEYIKQIDNIENIKIAEVKNLKTPFKFSFVKNNLIFIFFIVLILVVIIWRLPFILGKPQINLENFSGDLITTSSESIILKGKLINGDQLLINGSSVALNKDYTFEQSIALHPGLNVIQIQASKILGQKTEIKKQIYYEATGEKNILLAPSTPNNQTTTTQ